MCGICGFVGFEDKRLVKKMAETISHRGPDAKGIFTERGVSLAHNRLSIIDLSARGPQPMCNEDETVWVACNGEIYNFPELRSELEARKHRFKSDSDSEVLVHGYEEWGSEFFSRLRGDFAFALWDSRKKTMFLARDFPGVDQLYYYHDEKNKRLYFASEIKAILAAGVRRSVDLEGLNDFLSFQYALGPRTLFAKILKVQPGEMVVFKNGVLKKKTFFTLPSPGFGGKSESVLVREAGQKFAQSVERRLLSDVPLGVFL